MATSARTLLLFLFLLAPNLLAQRKPTVNFEALPFAPRQTVCYRTQSPLTVDGKLDEASWRATSPSELFVDIESPQQPRPRFPTTVKMLWDDDFFQRQFQTEHGRYASDLAALDAANVRVDGLEFRPSLQVSGSQYEIRANGFDGAVIHIRQDGRVWVIR